MSVLALFAHKRHAGGGGQRHADIQSNARVEGLGAALGVGGLGVGGGLVVVIAAGGGGANRAVGVLLLTVLQIVAHIDLTTVGILKGTTGNSQSVAAVQILIPSTQGRRSKGTAGNRDRTLCVTANAHAEDSACTEELATGNCDLSLICLTGICTIGDRVHTLESTARDCGNIPVQQGSRIVGAGVCGAVKRTAADLKHTIIVVLYNRAALRAGLAVEVSVRNDQLSFICLGLDLFTCDRIR